MSYTEMDEQGGRVVSPTICACADRQHNKGVNHGGKCERRQYQPK